MLLLTVSFTQYKVMCTLFFLWANQDILHGSKLQALDDQNILISDVTEMAKEKIFVCT